MMKSSIFTITFLLVIMLQTKAQSVRIISKDKATLDIFQPLDNAINDKVVTGSFKLESNDSINFDFNFSKFGYVIFQVKESSTRKFIPLVNNMNTTLEINEYDIEITGDNAEGIKLLNDTFISRGIGNYTSQIGNLFDTKKDKYDMKFNELSTFIFQDISKDILLEMSDLLKNNLISKEFFELMKRDFSLAIYTRIIDRYRSLLKETVDEYSRELIFKEIDRLYSFYPVTNPDISMYYYSSTYISSFFRLKYGNIESFEEQKLRFGNDIESVFGPYYIYLFAPDNIRLTKLCDAIATQKIYSVDEFETNKMISYLEINYPDSKYLSLISENIGYDDTTITKSEKKYSIIEDSVNSLRELINLPSLKHKYLFVDIWATWCNPCIIEFKENHQLYDLLDEYENLQLVYISIDDDKFDSHWKKSIQSLNLEGVHLRANRNIYDELKRRVYEEDPFSIPRYILIDYNGKIVNRNMPRIKDITKMREILDIYMEKFK